MPALAAEAVLEISCEANQGHWYDTDYTFTLYDDGSMLVETSFGSDVGYVQIPGELIPSGMGYTEVDLGTFGSFEEMIKAVAQRLAGYIMGGWSSAALMELISLLGL